MAVHYVIYHKTANKYHSICTTVLTKTLRPLVLK